MAAASAIAMPMLVRDIRRGGGGVPASTASTLELGPELRRPTVTEEFPVDANAREAAELPVIRELRDAVGLLDMAALPAPEG